MRKWLPSGKVVDSEIKCISNANIQTEVASSFPSLLSPSLPCVSSWQFSPFICLHLIFASFSHGLHPMLGNLTGSAYNYFSWSTVDMQCCANICCIAKWLNFTHICFFFNILFHYGYSPLCCTVGPCHLSILNVMFASNSSDSQFIPLSPPFPLAATSLIIYLDKAIIKKIPAPLCL